MPYPSPVTYPSPILYPSFASNLGGRQVSIGDLVLGAVDEFAVEWTLSKFDGWPGSPAPTLNLTQRARAHGSTAAESFLRSRVMTLEGLIHAPNLTALDDAFDRLNAAVTLDQTQMLVSETGGVRVAMVQRQGEVIPEHITDKLGKYSILIVAKDPRKYGDLATFTTLLPSSSGGATWPVTFPVTFTGVSNSGQVVITNPGNTQAPVWLRIDGPIPAGGWSVTHIAKQQTLTFASSLALAAGEFVTVDMEAREVLAQGQAPRSGYVTGRGWFTLDPGVNTIAFSAQNYSASAQLTVTTRAAWS